MNVLINTIKTNADSSVDKLWRFKYSDNDDCVIGPIDQKTYGGDLWSALIKFDIDYTTLFNKQKRKKAQQMSVHGLIKELAAICINGKINKKNVETHLETLKEDLQSGDLFVKVVEIKPDQKTISIADVASMLAELGVGLSEHFNLDQTAVLDYLDLVCKDKTGVRPINETINVIDTPTFITAEELNSWFSPINKGGLSIGELRSKAKELGVKLVSGVKKDDIRKALEELVRAPKKSTVKSSKLKGSFTPDGFYNVRINTTNIPADDLKELRKKYTVRKNNKKENTNVICKTESDTAMNGLINKLEMMGYENTMVNNDDGVWTTKTFLPYIKTKK